MAYAIEGAVTQVKRAFDIAADELRAGRGALNINILWEMGGAQRVLENVLERTKGLLHGVTCGAGMPYKLSEIAARNGVHYYPIISSGRAFRALWKRAYSKASEWLGAVVYEDPWLAGGHNGLSNAEDPKQPQDPYPRVKELREVMREGGIPEQPWLLVIRQHDTRGVSRQGGGGQTNKKACDRSQAFLSGARSWTRTNDPLINSQVL